MDLIKQVRPLTIEGKPYVMCFDMRSVAMFREISGTSFTNAMPQLFAGEDFTLINFMACTIRPLDKPTEVLGREIYKLDILGLLLNIGKDVTALIASSMPQATGKKSEAIVKTAKKKK